MLKRLMLLAGVLTTVNVSIADMVETEGLAPWETCAMCHGLDGVSAMAKFPKLAGQKPDYLTKQLADFRHGRRVNDGGQMAGMASELAPDDIAAVVDWFAGQTPPAPDPEPVPAAVSATAQTLTEQGRPDTLPACFSCHNEDRPDTPRLRAQHAPYLAKQLRDFRDGGRANDIEGEMRGVAAQLSDSDIDALAAYLASQARL